MIRISEVLILCLILFSCNGFNRNSNGKVKIVLDVGNTQNSIIEETKNSTADTIILPVETNKSIFKILSILPEASFIRGSFEWPAVDRELIFKNALNNLLINESDTYLVKKLVNSNHLKVGVVDGSWELLIYKTKSQSDIVLAHPKVGDDDGFYVYNFDGNSFTEIKDFFPQNYSQYFFNPSRSDSCKIKNDEEFNLMLDYYLNNDTVLVTNFYAKSDKQCFLGNIVALIYNIQTEKLELNSVYWGEVK